jgi:hypothetical protein
MSSTAAIMTTTKPPPKAAIDFHSRRQNDENDSMRL